MSDAVGKGTLLICVWANHPEHGDSGLTEGAIYTCDEVCDCLRARIIGSCAVCRYKGFRLTIVERQGICYCSCMFRPLNNGDTSKVAGEKEKSYDDILTNDAPIKTPEKV